MLSMNKYEGAYIDGCRAKFAKTLLAYDALAQSSKGKPADAFEPIFCNNMVLVLDNYFVHRLRGGEGKDGNPLNEVRVVAASLLQNDGRMMTDKTIKLNPETSVLGLNIDDEISLKRADIERLGKAFFAEMDKRFR